MIKASSIVQELYGGGVAAPDPVRAASFSQHQLVAKQIQETKEKAKRQLGAFYLLFSAH